MTMNEKQALEVLKAALDLSTSKGVFATLDQSATVINAYNIIAAKFQKDETSNDNTN